MKHKNYLIIISLCLSLLYSCSHSSIPEPETEKVVFQIVKATSNGDNWDLLASLPTLIEKQSVRLNDISSDDNGNIFVATSGGGIYKIHILDKSVQQLTNGLIPTELTNYNVQYVGAVLFNNNRIIAGSTNLKDRGGIFASDDGSSFQSKISWNKYVNITSLFKSPNGEIFAGCFLEIFRSNDGGNSWINETSNTEIGFGHFYSFVFDKYSNIYGATARGVYYSDFRKIQFRSIGLTDQSIRNLDINNDGWIYAVSGGKIYYSKDSGLSWQLNNNTINNGRCVYINKNNYLIVGTEVGIYRSKDNGATWELVGLKDKSVEKINMDPQGNLIAGTYMNEIYFSPQ